MTQYRLPKEIPRHVAVVGSRDFPKLQKVRDLVAKLRDDTILYSGGADGVDTAAEEAARARGLDVKIFPVLKKDWEKFGRSAGPRRNRKIVDAIAAERGFVFVFVRVDEYGVMTPGSENVIKLCEKLNVPCRVFTEVVDTYDL